MAIGTDKVLGSAAATSGDVTGRYLGEDQTSTAHFEAIEEWIRECSLNHTSCCRTASGRVMIDSTDVELPTRCIEITKKNIILRETTGWRGKYIALTHRWTDATEDTKTTTQNIEDRKQGRSLNGLPKVFEDAIEVARRLSVKYLWIDSLCIIQTGDNQSDWGKESRKMASYYQQAHLVLAGTAATKDDGLFIPRFHNNPRRVARLPYRDKAGARRGYFYIYTRDDTAAIEYRRGVANSELFERGWIFQEWVLSRRLVWYTAFGVFFECQTSWPRNTDQEVIGIDVYDSDPEVALGLSVRTKFNDSNKRPRAMWYQVIEAYSRLKLKYATDRIPAIQGVATEFRDMQMESQRNGSAGNGSAGSSVSLPNSLSLNSSSLLYVSGLWLQDIHYGLLWEQKSLETGSKRVASLPSWSWASRLAEVFWRSFPKHSGILGSACRVVGVVIEGVSYPVDVSCDADPQIIHLCDVDRASAAVLVSGRLQRVRIRGQFGSTEMLDRMSEFSGDVDGRHREARAGWRAVYRLASPDFVAGWCSIEDEEFQKRSDSAIVTALPVLKGTSLLPGATMSQWSRWPRVYGVLLLERMDERRFRRVGVGRVFEVDLMNDFDAAEEEMIELV